MLNDECVKDAVIYKKQHMCTQTQGQEEGNTLSHSIKTTDRRRGENESPLYSAMLSRKPSGPGLRVDVTLTRTSHLNTDIEQSISERLATKRFGGKKVLFSD